MALVEVCSFIGFLLLLGLVFPLIEIIIIIVSPQFHIKPVTSIKQDACDTPRQYGENSFADAILWADVGNDL